MSREETGRRLQEAKDLAVGLLLVGMDYADVKQHLTEKGFEPQLAQMATRMAEDVWLGRGQPFHPGC